MCLAGPRPSPTWWRSRTGASRSRFHPQVVEPSARAHRLAAELSTRFAIYGRTTGVGANRATAGIADRLRLRHAAASQPRGRCRRSARRQNGAGDARGAAHPAVRTRGRTRPRDPGRAGDDAQRRRAARASAIRVDRDRRPRAARRHGVDVDRRTARVEAVDADGAVGRRQRAAVHEQQRADGRARLPRTGGAISTRKGVERDLHAEFPCARTAIRRRCRRLRHRRRRRPMSTASRLACARCWRRRAGRNTRPARIQDPYGLRVYPVAQASRGGIPAFARGSARADAERRAGEPALRHRERVGRSITARSTRPRCRSNWTAPPWRWH